MNEQIQELFGSNVRSCEEHPNGLIIFGDVQLTKSIEIKFNVVHGSFDCSCLKFQLLKFSPHVVYGNFDCSYNKLESLEFVPKFIKGDFYCAGNQIPPWEHRYLLFSEIQGRVITNSQELDKFFLRYQNKKSLIPEALKELRRHGELDAL